MKHWRIHFAWTIVTALAVGVTSRIASRNDPEPVRLPVPERSVTVPEAVNPAAAPAPVEVPVALPVATPTPVLDEERLRALLASTEEFEKIQKILEEIPDRALQLKMLREAACGKEARFIYAAFQVLRKMKGRDVAEVLEASLSVQRDRSYGEYAAQLLGDVGDALSYTVLSEALQSKMEPTRINSADALRKLGYPAPAQEMAVHYTRQFESPDGSLRKKAVETLRQLHQEGSIAVFARALKDSNGDVRLEALYAFSRLDRKEYLPLLEPLVHDPNPEVAQEARDAVDGLKEEEK